MKKIIQKLSPIQWGYKPRGFCPVQSEGYFLGYYFYFRGRWDIASIDFAESNNAWWDGDTLYEKVLYKTDGINDAGWMPRNQCIGLIWKGCILFLIYQLFNIKL